MKTKVRLFRGPMQKLAKMKPAVRFQKRRMELMNSPMEQTMNSGFLPMMSEKMPAKKLPTEYPMNVTSVKSSSSGMFKKMTDRTNNPEIQNSTTSRKENKFCLLNMHIIKEIL